MSLCDEGVAAPRPRRVAPYGHSHGNLPDEPLALSLDVGVDTHEFRPWHFDEIQSVMQAKAQARESASQAERRAVLADLAAYDQEIGI